MNVAGFTGTVLSWQRSCPPTWVIYSLTRGPCNRPSGLVQARRAKPSSPPKPQASGAVCRG